MSSDNLNPTQILLTGCATLENRRLVPKKPFSFMYDASFACVETGLDGVLGCLRHYVGRDTAQKQDGVYDILAKITAYRSDRIIDGTLHEKDKIHVLGEIMRMRKVSLVTEEDLTACEEPARVTGSGMVTSIERKRLCFTIHGCQYVTGGDRSDDVVVRCRMDLNPKWAQPIDRLPHPPSIIAFSGVLQQFKEYSPPQSTKKLRCAVVALDDITYIRKGERSSTDPSTTVPPGKQNTATKFRSRTQKYMLSQLKVDNTPSPSTSQNTLGKRKAEESEEEVKQTIEQTNESDSV
ncbi:hypothetical protein EDB85DRAFT_1898982 [Lactarius pseudohatsudake]|nr:hypothetical protein EDB85DRAFT_1898982 [Lactarius pseudohatsudake]